MTAIEEMDRHTVRKAPGARTVFDNIVGISALFHDSACCLLRRGELIAAAEEERFSRRKHDSRVPRHAFSYCLDAGSLTIADIDCIAFYEDPSRKLARQIWTMLPGIPSDLNELARLDATRTEREIREVTGFDGPIELVDHHEAHAASAFYCSGFDEAAILTVDGVGEWTTTSYGIGRGADVDLFETVEFPDSLGLLYSTITNYLGFSVNDAEYKVMGAAAYGKPRFLEEMRRLVQTKAGGQFALDLKYFDFRSTERMYSDDLVGLFGAPARQRGAEVTDFHKDVAQSVQYVLEEILLEKAEYLRAKTGLQDLCMAGGVALNCVANGRILREAAFRRLFVQPAAGDSGGCIGAAAIVHRRSCSEGANRIRFDHAYWGPSYTSENVLRLLESAGLKSLDFRGSEGDLLDAVAARLAGGKVIGWFQGRMEFGPRALGARSILADPRDEHVRDRVNKVIKKREMFRPFAPSVLAGRAGDHFELDHASPFMLETCQVRSPLSLPAITHVDGSARVQTVAPADSPRFARLLETFERLTGCPILLNTSFNLSDEPIVCTPLDALVCFIRSELDSLVLEDFILDRDAIGPASQMLLRNARVSDPTGVTYKTYTLL